MTKTATYGCRTRCKNLQNWRSHPETQRRDAELCVSLDKEDAPPEDMELGKQFAQEVTLQCQ
jgi:ABC-type uncharacterized transport system substrate-binding protein